MENRKSLVFSGLAILVVLLIYIWFISMGSWRSRGYTSDYYSRLASAFLRGQISLEQKPDPALLALPNPYDHKARKNVPVLGDASLYRDKYYLYFGPFPSLALAISASIVPLKPGDQIFVYLFISGLFLLQCLLFQAILQEFFPHLPGWILPLGIVILGLTGPYLRMLAHPFIHEASIAGGELLLIAGFYSAFQALRADPFQLDKLLLAAILWSFSIATRITQLVPAGFIIVLTWYYILQHDRRQNTWQELRRATAVLLMPLAAMGILLAWYNWARFDSVFEFGLYYQLAGFNLQANHSILFSKVYLVQNVYNYFLNPIRISTSFPFFEPLSGTEKPVLALIKLPTLYAVEGKFPGTFFSTPFLLFAILPVYILVMRLIKGFRRRDPSKDRLDFLTWTILGLFGSFIAGTLPILLYYYVGFRFEADFIACLTLLALVGFCLGYQIVNEKGRKWYAIFGITLALFSIVMSVALSYNGARA